MNNCAHYVPGCLCDACYEWRRKRKKRYQQRVWYQKKRAAEAEAMRLAQPAPQTIFEAIDSRTSHDAHENWRPSKPCEPTKETPGSLQKIELLRARLERGQPLWHADDAADMSGCVGNPAGFTPSRRQSYEPERVKVQELIDALKDSQND